MRRAAPGGGASIWLVPMPWPGRRAIDTPRLAELVAMAGVMRRALSRTGQLVQGQAAPRLEVHRAAPRPLPWL
jgi:hypothetical protein